MELTNRTYPGRSGFFEKERHAIRMLVLGVLVCFFSMVSSWAAPLIIDDFSYSDNASARAAWTAMAGSPEVEMADTGEWGDERVMRLPCNFSVQPDRCYWDQNTPLDLSGYHEFALEIFVPDPGAFSSLTLYFHAGSGWYGNSRGITQPGWQTLYFSRIDFSEEASPSGWDQIDTIRLSPWKEADSDSYLAVRELRAFTPYIFIIRDTQTSDSRTVDGAIELLSDWLGRYNVSFGVVPGEAVESGYLDGSRLAILPYNEVISDPQMTQIETFVTGGGKLMVFYLLPDRIEDLLGIDQMGWIQGDFAAYTFSDSVIEHLPAKVVQGSWNITTAAPRAQFNARVIASWEDSSGAPTGDAAWLASDNGLFMSHILLRDDAQTKQFMLLVLLGHFVPEIWPPAAEAAIELIGRIAEYLTYGEAVPDIRARGESTPRTAQVEAALSLADSARTQAIAELNAAAYPEAVLSALDARAHLLEAYYLCQHPIMPEFRAVWQHSGTGPFPGDWQAAVDILADNGFNAVFPNMLWGGLAHYDSSLLPHSNEFNTYGDQITACVDAAHSRDIEVHVWKVNWNLSGAPQSFIDSMRAAGRTQVSATGDPYDWLCPSHPDNLALERDAMLEVVENYDVDGIHFDYIRYPNSNYCYCSGCRNRFETETGNPVNTWPADVRNGGPLETAFLDWRRAQVTELVDAVYQGVQARKPEVKVSAAVFSDYSYAYDGVGQDWVDWIDRDIVDFLCPMDYTEDHMRFRNLMAEQLSYAAGRIPIYPGIGATSSSSTFGPDGVIVQILATRDAGTGGFIVFDYGRSLAAEHLPSLGKGTTIPMTGLMRGVVDPLLCPLTGRPDMRAIFPLAPYGYIELPWEHSGYRLPMTDPNSPPDNSCLIFYQIDEADRITVVSGSDRDADILLERF
ncbi:glycoside hydrolase family 10 protein [Acidobacteriota bacterium]